MLGSAQATPGNSGGTDVRVRRYYTRLTALSNGHALAICYSNYIKSTTQTLAYATPINIHE